MPPIPAMLCVMLALSAADACSGTRPAGDPAGPSPTVSRLVPDKAAVGTTVTITGTGFKSADNAIKIGGGYLRDLPSSDGTTISFKLPDGMDLCPPFTDGPCIQSFMMLTPGDYSLTVITRDGTSNSIKLVVVER
jgi:hypothetical protein